MTADPTHTGALRALLADGRKAWELARFLASDPVRRAPTGRTPHRVIHRQNKAVVRYFAPDPDGVPATPLFISMPLINTWTVFDLLPDRSVVASLVRHGVPVYLLDWGRPGPEDAAVSMSDLVDDLLPRAVDRSLRHAATHHGADALDGLGYCVGGTFLAISLARHPDMLRRMALLASPIDFHASGRLATWARPETFPLDDIVDGFGNFPRQLMAASFAWLRPAGQIARGRSLWTRGSDPAFRRLWAAMEQWNGDNVDFPGEAYREYVRHCYFDNALVPGGPEWIMAGRPVDLGRGRAPAVAFAASDDHICPPPAAFGLARAWGGPVRTEVLRGGHVGVCIGRALPAALARWVDSGRGGEAPQP
ncbi:MAG: hypothetical protein D6798_07570 [Deltaproteobacteria bacterium]|nr:MAG: hypothetical protein D6798_07570 [Deltaproteobacteria bacterium]